MTKVKISGNKSEMNPHGANTVWHTYSNETSPSPNFIMMYKEFEKIKKEYPSEMEFSIYKKHGENVKIAVKNGVPLSTETNKELLTEENKLFFKIVHKILGGSDYSVYCYENPFFINGIYCNDNWILEEDLNTMLGKRKETPIIKDYLKNINKEKIEELLKDHPTLIFREHNPVGNAKNFYKPFIYVNTLLENKEAAKKNRNTTIKTVGISAKKIKKFISVGGLAANILNSFEIIIYYTLKNILDKEFPLSNNKYDEINKSILELTNLNSLNCVEFIKINQRICIFYLTNVNIVEKNKELVEKYSIDKRSIDKIIRKFITVKVTSLVANQKKK